MPKVDVKPLRCSSCQQIFTGKDLRGQPTARFPYVIWECKHSVCAACLKSGQNNNLFICPKCDLRITLPKKGVNIEDFFLPDIYALGLNAWHSKPPLSINDLKPRIIPAGCSSLQYERKTNDSFTVKQTILQNTFNFICDKCIAPAVYYCEKCKINCCLNCFQEIHSVSSKLKHVPKPIKLHEYRSLLQKFCQKHSKMQIEFFCENDEELLCCNCIQSTEHKDHETIPITEKNNLCFQDLERSQAQAKNTLKKLQKSQKFLEDSLPKASSPDISGFETEIRDNFHLLHSVLFQRENELISDLRKASNQSKNETEYLRIEIKNKILKLQYLLNNADQLLNNHYSTINGVKLTKELNAAAAETDTVIPLEVQNDEIRVALAPASIIHTLSKIGNIQCFMDSKFKLIKANDDSDEPEEDLETVIPLDTRVLPNNALPQNSYEQFFNTQHKVLEADKVQVTSVTSPGLFYVQRMNEIYSYSSLSDNIQKWCKKNKNAKLSEVTIGEIYLALYKDGKYYRALVEETIYYEPESESNQLPLPDCAENLGASFDIRQISNLQDDMETKVKVRYIDFGNDSVVKISELRNIKKSFLAHPPYAYKCCLWEVEPLNSIPEDEWSYESIECFYSFVRTKQVTMRVMDKVGDCLEVDLIHPISFEIESDCPVSVREALVFMEFACFPNNQPIPNLINQIRPRANFHAPEQLPSNTKLSVFAEFAHNPSKFYIQANSSFRHLENLRSEMKDFYTSLPDEEDFNVYVPKIGQPYVAILDDEVSYHRVLVKRLPGQANVEVYDVDTGCFHLIKHVKLKKIWDKFLELPMQAHLCCLADVEPIGGKWSSEAIAFFINTVRDEILEMVIHRSLKQNGYIVSLYAVQESCLLCINSLLVRKKFGSSVGTGSLELMVPKSEDLNLFFPVSGPKPKTKKSKCKSVPKIKSQSQVEEVPKLKYTEALVSFCQSPAYFFIQYQSDQKAINKLLNEMNEWYQNSVEEFDSEKVEVEVGSKYAVYDEDSSNWYRVTVEAVSDDHYYFVLLHDFGVIKKYGKNDLHELPDKFSNQGNFATQCSLLGLKPAGDNEKWSNIACEEFKKKVEDQIVYIGKSVLDDGVLSINLYSKVVILGGALEADRTDYLFINDYLSSELGVAIPLKEAPREDRDSSSPSEEITNVHSFPIPQLIDDFPEVNLRKPTQNHQWMVNDLPNWNHCIAIPTHVGYDGSIFIQTKDLMIDTCKEMSKGLEKAFASKPIPSRGVLKEGQICSARFRLDNKWYRATILQLYPDNVLIRFDDYGNEERVKWNDIRTEVGYLDIPLQRLQCDLHNVRPISDNSQWTLDALNFINITIVDKLCVVNLKEKAIIKQNLQVDIILTGGISLADLLVERNFARKIYESNSDFIPIAKSSFTLPFPLLTLPEDNARFPVVVPSFVVCQERACYICLQRNQVDHPETEYEIHSNIELKRFLEMCNNLEVAAQNSPTISNPKKGEMCCAQFSEDGSWYRCVISEIFDDKVVVIYTDYGNSEDIPIPSDRIRVLPEKFYKYPSQGIVCKLYDIAPAQSHCCKDVEKILKNLLVNCPSDKKLLAQAQIIGPPHEVNLFFQNDDSIELAYQKLIDEGLLVKLEPH